MKKNNKPISLKMFFICIIIGIVIFASVYIFQVILTSYQLEKAIIRFNLTLKQIMEYSENNKFNIDTKEFEMLLNSNYELLKDSINNSIKISMDNITFWFGFLSIIMVVFSILGIFMNNEYLERSKSIFQDIEKEGTKRMKVLNDFYLGLYNSNVGDYENAIFYYTQAINLDNNNFEAYSNRGFAYYNLNEYDKAISDYNEALKIKPDDFLTYNNRGMVYSRKGEHDKAIEDYNKAIEINPDFALTYNNISLAFYLKKDFDKALEYVKKSISINNCFSEAYSTMAMIYDEKKEYDKAMLNYNKALEFGKKNLDGIYTNIATLYMKQENINEALEYLNKAIEINPYNVEANVNLGEIYIRSDYDKALEYYEKAERNLNNINIKSNTHQIYYGIGYISYHKKLYLKALNNLIKAHELGNEKALSIIEKIDMPKAKEYIKNHKKL